MASEEHGTAGASARREHARRRDRREQAVRERHPHLGRLLLAVQGAPQAETRWAQGAAGEELVAGAVARRCPDVLMLHDRAVPGSRANIDHIAVAPSGLWVIDAKRYRGRIEVSARLFGRAKLKVAGRDRTKLVDALERQVELLRALVGEDAPVHGALCFVEGDLPLFGTPTVRGVPILHRRSLCRRLNRSGPLSPGDRAALFEQLADRLPPR